MEQAAANSQAFEYEEGLGPKENPNEKGWPEPFDIFGDPALTGMPTLKPEHLPKVISDFAMDAAERIGVPVEMIAIPALGVAGGVISDHFCLQVKEHDTTWLERSKLWIGMVADSGQKKTPALNTVLSSLKEIEKKLFRENEAKRQVYEDAWAEYRKKAKKDPCLIRPERPAFERKYTDNYTVESLRDILIDNPGGILLVKDELSGWFTSFNQYKANGGDDRSHYLELFNGGVHFIDRVKDGGTSMMVPNWSAGLVGGIQPGPMKRLAGKVTDDGLVQRFLVFYSGAINDGQDRPQNEKAAAAYRNAFYSLSSATWTEPPLRFASEAQKSRRLMDAIVRAYCELPDTPDHLRAHLSKYPIFFARLCLVCHLLNCAAEQTPPDPVIPVETAEAVYSLLFDFFLPNAIRFFNEILPGEDYLDDAKWIAGYLLSQSVTEITARDIYRKYRPLRDDKDGIKDVMAKLAYAGWVENAEPTRKDSSKWLVNPIVHKKFGELAQQERQRREAEKRRVENSVAFIRAAKELRQ